MKIKDTILEVCGPKYSCLEDVHVGDTDVITVGLGDESYVLNFEVGPAKLSVSIIDSDEGSLVDEYDDNYDSDTFGETVSNAVQTYESVIKNKEVIKEAQENRAQKELFDDILADGKPELFDSLSKDELLAFDEYIDNAVESDIGKRFAKFAVRSAIDKIDAAARKASIKEGFYCGDKVTVSGNTKVGTLVDRLDEDPLDSVGCNSGDFEAWVVEYEDGTREMADEDHIALVQPGPRDNSSDFLSDVAVDPYHRAVEEDLETSVDAEKSAVEDGEIVDSIVTSDVINTTELTESASIADLLYAVSQKLADLIAKTDDETQKVIFDDLSAQVEQIISELSVIVSEDQKEME